MAGQGPSSAVVGSIPVLLHKKLALTCEPGSNCLRAGQMPPTPDMPDDTSDKSAWTQYQSRTVPRVRLVGGFAAAWPRRNAQAGSLITATHDFPEGLRAEGMPMYSEGRP